MGHGAQGVRRHVSAVYDAVDGGEDAVGVKKKGFDGIWALCAGETRRRHRHLAYCQHGGRFRRSDAWTVFA